MRWRSLLQVALIVLPASVAVAAPVDHRAIYSNLSTQLLDAIKHGEFSLSLIRADQAIDQADAMVAAGDTFGPRLRAAAVDTRTRLLGILANDPAEPQQAQALAMDSYDVYNAGDVVQAAQIGRTALALAKALPNGIGADAAKMATTVLGGIAVDFLSDSNGSFGDLMLFDNRPDPAMVEKAETLLPLLIDYAPDFIDPADYRRKLARAEARLLAMAGDIDGAAAIYQRVYAEAVAHPAVNEGLSEPRSAPSLAEDTGPAERLAAAARLAMAPGDPTQRFLAIRDLLAPLGKEQLARIEGNGSVFPDELASAEALLGPELADELHSADGTRSHLQAVKAVQIMEAALMSAVAVPADATAVMAVHDFIKQSFGLESELAFRNAWQRIRIRANHQLEANAVAIAAAKIAGNDSAVAGLAVALDAAMGETYAPDSPEYLAFAKWRDSLGVEAGNVHPTDALVRMRAIADAFDKMIAGMDNSSDPAPAAGGVVNPALMTLAEQTLDAEARLRAVAALGYVPLNEIRNTLFFSTLSSFQEQGDAGMAARIADAKASYYRDPRNDDPVLAADADLTAATDYQFLGQFDAAFDRYASALRGLGAAGHGSDPIFSRALLNLSLLYSMTGKTQAAEHLLTDYRDNFAFAVSTGQLGASSSAASTALDALAQQLQQIAARPVDNVNFAEPLDTATLSSYARLAVQDGKIETTRTIVGILRMLGDIYGYDDVLLDADMAEVELRSATGDRQGAIGVEQQAIGHLLRLRPDFVRDGGLPLAAHYLTLARLQRLAGDTDAAHASLDQSVAMTRKLVGPDNPLLAALYWEQSANAHAAGRDTDVLAADEAALGRVVDPDSGFLVASAWTPGWSQRFTPDEILDDYLTTAWRLAAKDGGGPLAEQAFAHAQLSGLVAASDAIAKAAARAGSSVAVRDLLRQRQDVAGKLDLLRLAVGDDVQHATALLAGGNADELRGSLADLDRQIATVAPGLAESLRRDPVPVATIQKRLKPGEALLDVRAGGDAATVFLITPDSFDWQRAPLGAAALSNMVTALRRDLDPAGAARGPAPLAPLAGNYDFATAAQLYRGLFAPLLERHSGITHLYYSANAPLDALPLQVLVTAAPTAATPAAALRSADWLLRHYAVTVVPSVSVFGAAAAGVSAAPRPFLGIGDPNFAGDAAPVVVADAAMPGSFDALFRSGGVNLTALAQLPPLPESADEVRAIARSLGGDAGDLLVGPAATQRNVEAHSLADYRVIEFATHGLLAGDLDGLAEPALALTPGKPADAGDDGLLTMSEIAGLSLDADLVVLSACNTAGPDGRPGADALSGLAQAFFYAGARNLLVSHWPVDSAAAVAITTSAMQTGGREDWAVAVQHAMLRLLDSATNDAVRDPGYWGPFSVVGSAG